MKQNLEELVRAGIWLVSGLMVTFNMTGSCFGDEFLDAVVEFSHPPGSHFALTSDGNCLGPPESPTMTVNIDVPESLVVAFIDNMVIDGPGNDLFIRENGNGDSLVNIYGSAEGVFYEFLVQTSGNVSLDLSNYTLQTLRYLRIDGLGNGGSTPGWDFDYAQALNSLDIPFKCATDYHLNSIINFSQLPGSDDDGFLPFEVFGRPDTVSVSIDTPEILDAAFSDVRVIDGPGPDLYIYEHLNLDSSVEIFGSEDGINYEFLTETDRAASIDLADYALKSLRFLRFIGVDDGGDVPGYELDAAVAINFECVAILPGDVNLDGIVNLSDVAPFVFYLSNGQYHPQADVNQDGSLNLTDIAVFVDLIL